MERAFLFMNRLVCGVLLAVACTLVFANVVMRYGFQRPTIWATELSMTLCATAWVLAAGYVTERNRHISITMLEMIVGPRVWRFFRLFQILISIVAVSVLVAALWSPAMRGLASPERTGSALNSIQPTYFKLLLPVGCVLYVLQLLASLIRWAQGTERDADHGH